MRKNSGALKYILALAVCAFFAACPLSASADEFTESPDTAAMTEQLYHESRADELIYALPDSTRDLLGDIGLYDFMPDSTDEITPDGVLAALGKTVRENAEKPIRALVTIAAIVMISAALDTVKSDGSVDGALAAVTTLCVVSVIAPPLLGLTKELADIITTSGNFMLLYVPVISGLLIASGKAASGAMYSGLMVYVASAVMQITVRLVVPLLKCIMSLSVVSSACDKIRLGGVVGLFRKASRFILTFCMSLFVAFLTMRSIVTAAADSLANRAVKFAVSSFVPLVGGALSDAYQTVISCVTVLRSGVGAAAIAAIFAVFIPVAVRCAVWQAAAAVGAAVCELFGLTQTSSLLQAMSSVVSVIFAVLMCTMVIYIISTAIILIVGG